MKTDLDRIMEERNLDAFLVLGDASGNTILNYLTNNAHLERAVVCKRRGEPMVLIHGSMERDNAATTGLTLVDRDQNYNMYELTNKHEGNQLAANVDYLSQVIADQNLTGRLGIYGMQDAGAAYALFNHLQDRLTDTEIIGEFGDTLFVSARETKDEWEIGELRSAAQITTRVVGETQEFIQGHQVHRNIVVKSNGDPLTIGDVKAFTRSRIYLHGMHEDHGHIFSQGRDAAVPHNSGTPDMPLELGKSIIFDIFPQTESNYFHDLTRTWSLGYATDEVQEAWDQTKELFDMLVTELALGRPYRDYQLMACKFYEARGHRTTMSHPGTYTGYVHSLGHGIGLDIHEFPRFSHSVPETSVLAPGHVVSIEPGLYYPEQGFGVRIEDSVAYTPDGTLINLSDYPYDLVIPMR